MQPETFWDTTPKIHAAIMRGCMARERRSVERDAALAWRMGNFGAAAQVGKLKNLDHYLDQLRPQDNRTVLDAVAAFQSLAARGLAKIREVPKKG